jgi:hypothetical protein
MGDGAGWVCARPQAGELLLELEVSPARLGQVHGHLLPRRAELPALLREHSC